MTNEWVSFLEFIERLPGVTPGILKIGWDCAREVSCELPPEAERDSSSVSANGNHANGNESLPNWTTPSSILPWQTLLDYLRKSEDLLKASQGGASEGLSPIRDARAFFENALKEKLRGECQQWPVELFADLQSGEEELLAGLQEIEHEGGLELHQFIGELERMVHGRDRVGT